jgi:hypothetical protein
MDVESRMLPASQELGCANATADGYAQSAKKIAASWQPDLQKSRRAIGFSL